MARQQNAERGVGANAKMEMLATLNVADFALSVHAFDWIRINKSDVAREHGKSLGELAGDLLKTCEVVCTAVDGGPAFHLRAHYAGINVIEYRLFG
jgi:hypothetical protein